MKGKIRGVLIGIQQFTAFLAVICFALLGIYSIGAVPVYRQINGGSIYSNYYFHVDLFSGEEELADTRIFNSMLLNTLESVIRYNVAKSQLETDGFFDVDKEIDILSFVNRKETMGMDSRGEENTASGEIAISKKEICYTVGDLLKWAQYGISYESQSLTAAKFVGYYPPTSNVITWGDLSSEEEAVLEQACLQNFTPSEETAGVEVNEVEVLERFWEYLEMLEDRIWLVDTDPNFSEIFVLHRLAEMLISGDCGINGIYIDEQTGDLMVRFRQLEERYKPQGMHTLMACADSWAQYQIYTEYLEQTIQDISYNYGEYQGFKQRYQEGATNLVYDFQMTMMGENVEVSNLPDSVPEAERDAYFKEHFGKYIIYQPGSIILDTNLPYLQTDDLFSAFFAYSYAYPETAQIWIGVDTTYPVEDVFARVNADYTLLRPYANVVLSLGISCILIWFVFLILLSILQRPKESQGAALYKLPTELLLCMLLLYVWGVTLAGFWLWEYGTGWFYYVVNFRQQLVWLAGLMGLIVSGLFCLLWYAVIKKIKLHRWFADNLLVRLFKMIKRQCVQIIENANIWLKNFLLWGGIMLFNFLIGQALSWFWFRRHTLRMLFIFAFLIVVDICVMFSLFYHKVKRRRIEEGIKRIGNGELDYRVDTADLYGENMKLAEAVNTLGSSVRTAVETSMKDERLKADLITNVSHDIKTPLTSIINYVDLLKREKIEIEPIKGYIAVLDSKSQRLKQLTDDLLEASKISSGNITLTLEKIQVTELLNQALGEFSERFAEKQLMVVEGFSGRDVCIYADSRRIWRVVENLLGNACKYAMPGTRIYLDMAVDEEKKQVGISIKNISAQPLNIPAKELTERFIRGDVSRSTEGSGLGLSIAKSLTELQNGSFDIYLDGDLFKVTLEFPLYEEPAE